MSIENGHLFVRLGNPDFSGVMQHWHDNTFRITWRKRFYSDDYATFDRDALGKPTKLSLAWLSLQFERERPTRKLQQ